MHSARFLLFLPLGDSAGPATIAAVYAVRCVGITFLLTPSTALGVRDLDQSDKAYGAAILNSFRQMSGALFSTIMVVAATVASAGADIDLGGIHAAFLIMSIMSAIGIVLAKVI